MADNDLESFFAKRDKKRPKGKKFATADDAAKVLENNARERKKNEMKSNYIMPLTESGEVAPPINEYRQQPDEDDEWKETVEVQPDFSNLKIQELILDDDDELDGKESEGRIDTDIDAKEGPWNKKGKDDKSDSQTLPIETPEAGSVAQAPKVGEEKGLEKTAETNTEGEGASTETTTKSTGGYVPPNRRKEAAETASKLASEPLRSSSSASAPSSSSSSSDAPKGAYVPPSRRGQAASSSSSSSSGAGATRSKKPVSAPNIENTEAFPSLGS